MIMIYILSYSFENANAVAYKFTAEQMRQALAITSAQGGLQVYWFTHKALFS